MKLHYTTQTEKVHLGIGLILGALTNMLVDNHLASVLAGIIVFILIKKENSDWGRKKD